MVGLSNPRRVSINKPASSASYQSEKSYPSIIYNTGRGRRLMAGAGCQTLPCRVNIQRHLGAFRLGCKYRSYKRKSLLLMLNVLRMEENILNLLYLCSINLSFKNLKIQFWFSVSQFLINLSLISMFLDLDWGKLKGLIEILWTESVLVSSNPSHIYGVSRYIDSKHI